MLYNTCRRRTKTNRIFIPHLSDTQCIVFTHEAKSQNMRSAALSVELLVILVIVMSMTMCNCMEAVVCQEVNAEKKPHLREKKL